AHLPSPRTRPPSAHTGPPPAAPAGPAGNPTASPAPSDPTDQIAPATGPPPPPAGRDPAGRPARPAMPRPGTPAPRCPPPAAPAGSCRAPRSGQRDQPRLAQRLPDQGKLRSPPDELGQLTAQPASRRPRNHDAPSANAKPSTVPSQWLVRMFHLECG